MGDLVIFPIPLPLVQGAQDVADQTDLINQLIRYINTIVYGDNVGTQALLKANNLSDLNNAATARTNLGLGTASTMSSTAFDAAGAAAAVLATSLQKASNLSDLVSAATARTNLGLGSASTMSSTAFDPAGAAASRAAAGINGDITALTALSVLTALTTDRVVIAGNQTLEFDATGGAITVTYPPTTSAGRVKIVKTDTSYNPVNISDGTNILYELVAPSNGLSQSVEIYTNGAAIIVT